MDNQLLPFFPLDNHITEIRLQQRIALDEIWNAIISGEKHVTLQGSTGVGKSKIGETVSRYFQSLDINSCYTSPLNSLVDQIEETKHVDSHIHTLKGKRYTKCIAKGNDTHCDEGYCAKRICYITRNLPKENRAKRDCIHCNIKECVCRGCLYKAQFKRYKESKVGNTNASLWLMGIVPDETKVLIIDEVDSLEDFVRMNNTVTIPFHVDDEVFSNHLAPLESYADHIECCLDCEKDFNCTPKNHLRLQGKIDSIRSLVNDYESHCEPWVIRKESNQLGEPRTRYEPITVSRFTEPLLDRLDFVLAMSATPPRWPNYKFIEVPSPFPVDIRQCYYHPLGRMTYKKRTDFKTEREWLNGDHRDANIPKLAEFIHSLRGKSIVHCNSYENAMKLSSALKGLGIFPLIQVNDQTVIDDEYTINRWDAIRAFKSSRDINQVLLSVGMGVGVDLFEPEIQTNIIGFIPFQNYTDKLVEAKTRLLGESWKDEKSAIMVEQMHGRIHRGIYYLKDVVKTRPDLSWLPVNPLGQIVKRTFITDSNFQNGKGRLFAWYSRNQRYFSESFKYSVRL